MLYAAQDSSFKCNAHFMDMVQHPTNPLTNNDLIKLVDRFPEQWKRFSNWIGKLSD